MPDSPERRIVETREGKFLVQEMRQEERSIADGVRTLKNVYIIKWWETLSEHLFLDDAQEHKYDKPSSL